MSKYSRITFDFAQALEVGDVVSFEFSEGASDVIVTETFAETRYTSGIVPIAPSGSPIQTTAVNFAEAFAADYNANNLFVIERDGTEVNIYSTIAGIDFSNASAPASTLVEIDNSTDIPLTITDVRYLAGSTCGSINVEITTNVQADEMLSPTQMNNPPNPLTLEYDRFLSFELILRKGSETVSRVIPTPARIFPSGITLEVTATPAGSSVKIVTGGYLLNLTYSLNGTDFTANNVFTNLIGGDYTAYVKDQFNCVTEKDFRIDSFGINAPYFYLPTANSIRYANRVNWGDCSNYKNDDNTLSCEVDTPVKYQEIQLFQSCDKIITQFKSNYGTHLAKVNIIGDEGGLGTSIIPITQKTNNMRLSDRRDAIIITLPNGKTGVYFQAGNLYNFDTGAVVGDYTLNGALPVWGKSGNFLQYNNNWHLIQDTAYIDNLGAEVLIIDTITAFPVGTPVIVGSIYNLHNYEVYEFEIDFFNYLDKNVQVSLTATDDYFPEVKYLSEIINVKVRHQTTVEVKYWDDENTDVFFATGIQNKMRLTLEKDYGQPAGEIESHDTDTDTILLESDIRQRNVFVFSPMTKAMMFKVDEALSHDFITIDGVPYGDKKIEVSENLGKSNLYNVVATMKKSKSVYRSSSITFDDSAVEIPALIPVDDGYVKYR